MVIGLTLFLLYLVLQKVGLEELIATIKGADLTFVVLAFILAPLSPLVSAIKWQILVRSQGKEVPLWYLFKLYMVGYFFNNFLPSNVGGDVARVYELGNRTKDPAGAAASVFMERLSGFIVLFAIAIIALLGNLTIAENSQLILTLVMVLVLFTGVMLLIWDTHLLNFVEKTFRFKMIEKYVNKFRKFHNQLHAYKRDPHALAWSFVWSMVFHGTVIINMYIAALAFHKPIPFWGIAAITPIIGVVSMLPLTFNGIGIQEWAYVILFSWLGLPISVGLSAAILIRAKVLMMAVAGGLFYAGSKIQATAAT